MKRSPPNSSSIVSFVVVFACISLMLAGCLWQTRGHDPDSTTEESALESLVVEGHELHASLRTSQPESIRDLPTSEVPPANPHLSSEEDFAEAIARGGSQGRLGREGIRSALYARYTSGENEVGCYALEADSDAHADQRENALREIWAYNANLQRASVHRKDLVLVVIWNDGVTLIELGTVDAPNLWVWNIGGYILPGIAVALLGAGVASHFRGQRHVKLVSSPLIVSGLMMSVSGIFPGDLDHRTSPTMILHAIGSVGSFVAFLVAGFSFPWLLRRFASWRAYAWPSLLLVVLSIASGFLRSGEAPGIGQRIGFLLFFAWVALIGAGLFNNSRIDHSLGAA